MNRFRSLVAVAGYTLTVVIALAAVLGALSANTVDYSLAKGREIDIEFREAAMFVDNYIRLQGALPTQNEYDKAVLKGQPKHQAMKPFMYTSSFPTEAIERFGEPPKGAYVLGYWRGEWMEYYASWKRASTTGKSAEQYYLFGNVYVQTIVLLSAAVSVFAIARRVKRAA